MFDFSTALHALDPRFDWTITPLTGGLVNSTIRATKKQLSSDNFADNREQAVAGPIVDLLPYTTLVAKHAPPYVANLGPDAPFSQFRQTIEARALQLLSSTSLPHARCPKFIYHDFKLHLLLMEDLGALSNLQDFLLHDADQEKESAVATIVAEKLGQALAHLHNIPLGITLSKLFENVDMYDVVFDTAVAGIEEKLNRFGIEDAKQLGQRCAESFEEAKRIFQDHQDGSAETTTTKAANATDGVRPDSLVLTSGSPFVVFSMGDMWPPSILVNHRSNSSSNPISLIDWEFSGPGLPLQDIAQLTAHLEIYKMANPSIPSLQSFSKTMIESYLTESKKINAAWLPIDLSMSSNSSTYIENLRHGIILHGRELINVGTEKDWGSKGASTNEIVKRGADYLRTAGNNPQDMDLALLEKDDVFAPLASWLSPLKP